MIYLYLLLSILPPSPVFPPLGLLPALSPSPEEVSGSQAGLIVVSFTNGFVKST